MEIPSAQVWATERYEVRRGGSRSMGYVRGRRKGRRLRERSRGVTLVEFAVVAPVLLLLLLGMVDFGFAFGDYISLRNGVREGARQAAINPPGSRTCTLDSPAPPNAATQNLACLTKDRIGLDDGDVQVAIVLLDGDDTDTVAGGVGDPVRVCARIPAESTSGITQPFFSGRTIAVAAEMRIETPPAYVSYSEGGIPCS